MYVYVIYEYVFACVGVCLCADAHIYLYLWMCVLKPKVDTGYPLGHFPPHILRPTFCWTHSLSNQVILLNRFLQGFPVSASWILGVWADAYALRGFHTGSESLNSSFYACAACAFVVSCDSVGTVAERSKDIGQLKKKRTYFSTMGQLISVWIWILCFLIYFFFITYNIKVIGLWNCPSLLLCSVMKRW